MKKINILIIAVLIIAHSCKKSDSPGTPAEPGNNGNNGTNAKVSYGDSIFFTKNQATDYIINPTTSLAGTFTSYPQGLVIDANSGAINISQSEAGLRYKITFTPSSGAAADSTFIIISGLNYFDQIYKLNQDTFAYPVYNAEPGKPLPSGNYNLGSNKLVIDAQGRIDIKKTTKELFGNNPENGDWKEEKVEYNINDNSGGKTNKFKVVVYYYDQISDIPSNVSAAMRAHQEMFFGRNKAVIPVTHAPVDNDIDGVVFLNKPRPPCVIILGAN